MELQWNYNECERVIVDFCLQKLEKCIEREYDEHGSFKSTNADRFLDCKLGKMIDEKGAWRYAYIKCFIEFLMEDGYKIKCMNHQTDDIILRLFGMSDREGKTIKEFVKIINNT